MPKIAFYYGIVVNEHNKAYISLIRLCVILLGKETRANVKECWEDRGKPLKDRNCYRSHQHKRPFKL